MTQTLKSLILCLALLAPTAVFAQDAAPAPETTQQEAPADPAQAAPAQSAPSATGPGAIGTPPEGKGLVVFFREKKFAGSAIRYKVREGTTELGTLISGGYFVHVADPGAHAYTDYDVCAQILGRELMGLEPDPSMV